MIGTALMILVIGGQRTSEQADYMPWDITVLEDGSVQAFGITLNKTQIQDANQILSSFPETRLINDLNNKPLLVAYYDEVAMSGLMAEFELEYNLEQEKLLALEKQANYIPEQEYALLPEAIEMELLNTTVARLSYMPLIDYDIDIILQRFGQPGRESQITEFLQLLEYSDLGLSIYINSAGQDKFVYTPVNRSQPSTPGN